MDREAEIWEYKDMSKCFKRGENSNRDAAKLFPWEHHLFPPE